MNRRQSYWRLLKTITKVSNAGNRCGHDPDHPKFMINIFPYGANGKHREMDNTGERRRSMLQYAIIEKLHEYFNNPKMLPMLNAVNGSDRQQRSERRESIIGFIESCIYSMDLVSLRVGYPGDDGTFVYRTMEYLAEKAGLNAKRAERALADIKACGFITVKKACKKNSDNTFTGMASTKCIAREFLAFLGFDKWLSCERNRASSRKREKDDQAHKDEAYSAKGRARSALMAKMLSDSLSTNVWADISDYQANPDPTPTH